MLNLGPAVGAFFYEIGGFSLPFVICGSFNLTLAVLLLLTIPTRNAETSPELEKKENTHYKDFQESEITTEYGMNSNDEKRSLIKEIQVRNGTAIPEDEALGKTVLGYVQDSKSIRCYYCLPVDIIAIK